MTDVPAFTPFRVRALFGDRPTGTVNTIDSQGRYHIQLDTGLAFLQQNPKDWVKIDDVRTPVTVKTRRTIINGGYGIVLIDDQGIEIPVGRYSPDELREAAHVLNQIAEIQDDR